MDWNAETSLKKMEEKQGSYLDIIATFIRAKKIKLKNSQHLSLIIKRNAKTAKEIEGIYTTEELYQCMDELEEDKKRREKKFGYAEWDWGIETCVKQLLKR